MQYFADFGDSDNLTWNLPEMTIYLQQSVQFAWFRRRGVGKATTLLKSKLSGSLVP